MDKTKEFVDKATLVHGDKYDYSIFQYVNCKTKGIIICKKHGGFLQNANNHLQGKGCSKCAGKKINNFDFIEKAIHLHGDVYDYSKVEYLKSTSKIIIICKKHGEFLQTPDNHLQGNGCNNCRLDLVGKCNKDTIDDFIKKAIHVHGDVYDYSKVDYLKSTSKIIIICKKHGEFLQTSSSHIRGCGCPTCAGVMLISINDFIKKAINVHGDVYDYLKFEYINCKTKGIIICKKHGEFLQTPDSHINGNGCPTCAKIIRSEKRMYTKDEFIEKSIEKHGNIYDYTKVEYVDTRIPVIIICKKHGEFKQVPINHYSGNGCQICGINRSKESKKYTKDEFIEKSIKKHGNIYDYTKVEYVDTRTPVIIICKKHGEFKQVPQCHYTENGCPKCAFSNYSKVSIQYLNFISSMNKIFIVHAENNGEYIVDGYKADGYCKETNTIYEFHGDFWHGNPFIYDKEQMNPISKKTFGELYQRTIEKEQHLKQLGYNVVVMWENQWTKINRSIRILQKIVKRQYEIPIQ